MRIAVDAMGGDYAPAEIVAGVVEASELVDKDDELILIGPVETVQAELSAHKFNGSKVRVVDAPEVIAMDEALIDALRKKRKSSIAVMATMAATTKRMRLFRRAIPALCGRLPDANEKS